MLQKYSLYEGTSFILTFSNVYVYVILVFTNKYPDHYINHGFMLATNTCIKVI